MFILMQHNYTTIKVAKYNDDDILVDDYVNVVLGIHMDRFKYKSDLLNYLRIYGLEEQFKAVSPSYAVMDSSVSISCYDGDTTISMTIIEV